MRARVVLVFGLLNALNGYDNLLGWFNGNYTALDGGRHLAEILKNLPQRNLMVKSGHHHHSRVVVPAFEPTRSNYQDLLSRCRTRWARRRTDVEREIRNRIRPDQGQQTQEVLRGWD